MKVSEIARYYAAKELAKFVRVDDRKIQIDMPLSCPDVTFEINCALSKRMLTHQATERRLQLVRSAQDLTTDSVTTDGEKIVVCANLQQGRTLLPL